MISLWGLNVALQGSEADIFKHFSRGGGNGYIFVSEAKVRKLILGTIISELAFTQPLEMDIEKIFFFKKNSKLKW